MTLILIPVLLLLCLTSTLAGILIGQETYQRPSLAGSLVETSECQLPCWQSLLPGNVSLTAADRTIQSLGYIRRERPFSGPVEYTPGAFTRTGCEIQLIVIDNAVDRVRLFHCPPTRLGDLIALVGQPEGVISDRFAIVFRGGRVLAYAERIICEQRYSPDTFIGMIDFVSQNRRAVSVYPWRGFVDLRRYMPRSRVDLQC